MGKTSFSNPAARGFWTWGLVLACILSTQARAPRARDVLPEECFVVLQSHVNTPAGPAGPAQHEGERGEMDICPLKLTPEEFEGLRRCRDTVVRPSAAWGDAARLVAAEGLLAFYSMHIGTEDDTGAGIVTGMVASGEEGGQGPADPSQLVDEVENVVLSRLPHSFLHRSYLALLRLYMCDDVRSTLRLLEDMTEPPPPQRGEDAFLRYLDTHMDGSVWVESFAAEFRSNPSFFFSVWVSAKRMHAFTLLCLRRYEDAVVVYRLILQHSSDDFASSAVLGMLRHKLGIPDPYPEELTSQALYRFIQRTGPARNYYQGFAPEPGSGWAPDEFAGDQFNEAVLRAHSERREPLVVRGLQAARLGNQGPVVRSLDEAKQRLCDPEELVRTAGNLTVAVERVRTERSRRPGGDGGGGKRKSVTFGKSVEGYNRRVKFRDHVQWSFRLQERVTNDRDLPCDGRDLECFDYMNLQSIGMREDPWVKVIGALRELVPVPSVLSRVLEDPAYQKQISLWLGRADGADVRATAMMHIDESDNLLVVLRGKKVVHLVPPSELFRAKFIAPPILVTERGLMIPFKGGPTAHRSDFTTMSADTFSSVLDVRDCAQAGKDFCDMANASMTSVELRENDALYIPFGWAHAVESEGVPHIALNFWWNPKRDPEGERIADEIAVVTEAVNEDLARLQGEQGLG